jgi:hypothetical protein
MNHTTRAFLATTRRVNTMAALRARQQWHALSAMGFHWRCDEPRRAMRARLAAARLYRRATRSAQ